MSFLSDTRLNQQKQQQQQAQIQQTQQQVASAYVRPTAASVNAKLASGAPLNIYEAIFVSRYSPETAKQISAYQKVSSGEPLNIYEAVRVSKSAPDVAKAYAAQQRYVSIISGISSGKSLDIFSAVFLAKYSPETAKQYATQQSQQRQYESVSEKLSSGQPLNILDAVFLAKYSPETAKQYAQWLKGIQQEQLQSDFWVSQGYPELAKYGIPTVPAGDIIGSAKEVTRGRLTKSGTPTTTLEVSFIPSGYKIATASLGASVFKDIFGDPNLENQYDVLVNPSTGDYRVVAKGSVGKSVPQATSQDVAYMKKSWIGWPHSGEAIDFTPVLALATFGAVSFVAPELLPSAFVGAGVSQGIKYFMTGGIGKGQLLTGGELLQSMLTSELIVSAVSGGLVVASAAKDLVFPALKNVGSFIYAHGIEPTVLDVSKIMLGPEQYAYYHGVEGYTAAQLLKLGITEDITAPLWHGILDIVPESWAEPLSFAKSVIAPNITDLGALFETSKTYLSIEAGQLGISDILQPIYDVSKTAYEAQFKPIFEGISAAKGGIEFLALPTGNIPIFGEIYATLESTYGLTLKPLISGIQGVPSVVRGGLEFYQQAPSETRDILEGILTDYVQRPISTIGDYAQEAKFLAQVRVGQAAYGLEQTEKAVSESLLPFREVATTAQDVQTLLLSPMKESVQELKAAGQIGIGSLRYWAPIGIELFKLGVTRTFLPYATKAKASWKPMKPFTFTVSTVEFPKAVLEQSKVTMKSGVTSFQFSPSAFVSTAEKASGVPNLVQYTGPVNPVVVTRERERETEETTYLQESGFAVSRLMETSLSSMPSSMPTIASALRQFESLSSNMGLNLAEGLSIDLGVSAVSAQAMSQALLPLQLEQQAEQQLQEQTQAMAIPLDLKLDTLLGKRRPKRVGTSYFFRRYPVATPSHIEKGLAKTFPSWEKATSKQVTSPTKGSVLSKTSIFSRGSIFTRKRTPSRSPLTNTHQHANELLGRQTTNKQTIKSRSHPTGTPMRTRKIPRRPQRKVLTVTTPSKQKTLISKSSGLSSGSFVNKLERLI
jgi:hypothetical protein